MCFFGFLSGVSVGKMILYSQKKSQIQFPVFETKYHPRYHSNWHKAPLLRIQSYTPQGNGCGLRQFLLSLNRISKLPSKVHSANSSIPQSHRLRLSVHVPKSYLSQSSVCSQLNYENKDTRNSVKSQGAFCFIG